MADLHDIVAKARQCPFNGRSLAFFVGQRSLLVTFFKPVHGLQQSSGQMDFRNVNRMNVHSICGKEEHHVETG
jgi:hypothetical protein